MVIQVLKYLNNAGERMNIFIMFFAQMCISLTLCASQLDTDKQTYKKNDLVEITYGTHKTVKALVCGTLQEAWGESTPENGYVNPFCKTIVLESKCLNQYVKQIVPAFILKQAFENSSGGRATEIITNYLRLNQKGDLNDIYCVDKALLKTESQSEVLFVHKSWLKRIE